MKKQRFGNPTPWADLMAFLGVLSLGGTLIAETRMTAVSLATACVALGGLYAAFKRFQIPSDGPPQADDSYLESADPEPGSREAQEG